MKKIILMGRSECGKTTLTQALKGDVIHYHKTQYINHYDVVIDTPGEYAENASLYRGGDLADPQLSPGAGRRPALGFGTGG